MSTPFYTTHSNYPDNVYIDFLGRFSGVSLYSYTFIFNVELEEPTVERYTVEVHPLGNNCSNTKSLFRTFLIDSDFNRTLLTHFSVDLEAIDEQLVTFANVTFNDYYHEMYLLDLHVSTITYLAKCPYRYSMHLYEKFVEEIDELGSVNVTMH